MPYTPVVWVSRSHEGRYIGEAHANEDEAFTFPEKGQLIPDAGFLAVVLDGMSSGGRGVDAKVAATINIRNEWKNQQANALNNPLEAIYALMQVAQDSVLQSLDNQLGGTTCLIVLIQGDLLSFGHVGDCQLFIRQADKPFRLVTEDQTALYRTEAGRKLLLRTQSGNTMLLEDARYAQLENTLTRFLGRKELPSPAQRWVEVGQMRLSEGDVVLMCSDGVIKAIDITTYVWTLNKITDSEADMFMSDLKQHFESNYDDMSLCVIGMMDQPDQVAPSNLVSYKPTYLREIGETYQPEMARSHQRARNTAPLFTDYAPQATKAAQEISQLAASHNGIPQRTHTTVQASSQEGKASPPNHTDHSSQNGTNPDPVETEPELPSRKKRLSQRMPLLIMTSIVGLILLGSVGLGVRQFRRSDGIMAANTPQDANTPQAVLTPRKTSQPTSSPQPASPRVSPGITQQPTSTSLTSVSPGITQQPASTSLTPDQRTSEPSTVAATPSTAAATPTSINIKVGPAFSYAPFTYPVFNNQVKYGQGVEFIIDTFAVTFDQANTYASAYTALYPNGSCPNAPRSNIWNCLHAEVEVPHLIPPQAWFAFTALVIDERKLQGNTKTGTNQSYTLPSALQDIAPGKIVQVVGMLDREPFDKATEPQIWQKLKNTTDATSYQLNVAFVRPVDPAEPWKLLGSGDQPNLQQKVWLYSSDSELLTQLDPDMPEDFKALLMTSKTDFLVQAISSNAGPAFNTLAIYTKTADRDEYRCAIGNLPNAICPSPSP